MKTRIISGIVMIAIVIAVLVAGLMFNPLVITLFIALLCAVGTYELLCNACKIEDKVCLIGACIYAVDMTSVLDVNISKYLKSSFYPFCVTAIYFVFAVIMILKNHKSFTLDKIAVFSAMPIFICYAFNTLSSVINHENGIYYLLLLLNFSSCCDMGAYFVGVTMGKHKLCPEISPKKTVEGAIGGIVTSVIVALILVLCFNRTDKILLTLLLTVPLCIVGMLGDLFASSIKRAVGIKDYGTLIPGHGGVLDRVDSILLIAPVLYMFVNFGVI